MTGSYRSINYSLRPAKYAERKMLAEVFRRLEFFDPIEEYVYVGFGGLWYADFSLFHRLLGIRDMISFERDVHARDRFEANKPFLLNVDYRSASEALPDLDWGRRQFIWLDYDEALSVDILSDVRLVASRARSGTVLVVSVPCFEAAQFKEEREEESGVAIVTRFIQEFGKERVPSDMSESKLRGWPFGTLSLDMIKNEILDGVVARNSDGSNPMFFSTICQFRYMDGVKMMTLVGIFYTEDEVAKYESCRFDQLDFVTDPETPVRIEVPILTIRELRFLERQLPVIAPAALDLGSIPESEANRFAKMYRYFPNFSVIEN